MTCKNCPFYYHEPDEVDSFEIERDFCHFVSSGPWDIAPCEQEDCEEYDDSDEYDEYEEYDGEDDENV